MNGRIDTDPDLAVGRALVIDAYHKGLGITDKPGSAGRGHRYVCRADTGLWIPNRNRAEDTAAETITATRIFAMSMKTKG